MALSADGTVVAMMYERKSSYNGVVRVYAWDNAAAEWAQRGTDIYGPLSDTLSSSKGLALSHTGTVMAIGYTTYFSTNTPHQVRVFQWANGAWNQMGPDILGSSLYNQEGASVALSADGLIVASGAPYEGPSYTGHVRVWMWDLSLIHI